MKGAEEKLEEEEEDKFKGLEEAGKLEPLRLQPYFGGMQVEAGHAYGGGVGEVVGRQQVTNDALTAAFRCLLIEEEEQWRLETLNPKR